MPADLPSPRTPGESSTPRTPVHTLSPTRAGRDPIPPDIGSWNPFAEPSSPQVARERRQPAEGRQRRSDDLSDPTAASSSAADAPGPSTGPVPTGWNLSEVRPRYRRQLSISAGRRANLFKNYIRQGYSPTDAASLLGPGSVLKPLNPSTGQYEIRLNHRDRLTFLSDDAEKKVTILEIGGHT
jgi:hypothetical protein